MSDLIVKLKPAAPRRVQLLLAAGTWTVVGLGLGMVGVRWSSQGEAESLALWIALAVAVGLVKAVLAVRPAADRVIRRINERGDGRCAGGFFSWRTWIFVACMIVVGRLLRLSGMPVLIVGLIYIAVGVALVAASLQLWRAWYRASWTGGSEGSAGPGSGR